MTQNTVDNSGWQSHLKYISVWGPLAAIQLTTIGGLGYFYGRLESLDQVTNYNTLPKHSAVAVEAKPAPVVQAQPFLDVNTRFTYASLHIPATVVEMPNPLIMQIGQTFAPKLAETSVATHTVATNTKISPKLTTTPSKTASSPAKTYNLKSVDLNPVLAKPVKAKTSRKEAEKPNKTQKTLVDDVNPNRVKAKEKPVVNPPVADIKQADKANTPAPTAKLKASKANELPNVKPPEKREKPKAKREKLPLIAVDKPRKKASRVNSPALTLSEASEPAISPRNANGRWVYLGELRNYGWYGQKLHIAPNSGLPNVGQTYRTQLIHGTYDQPHGNRSMGGFQQGDVVQVENVQHETNGKVWAKLSKIHEVGRFDE